MSEWINDAIQNVAEKAGPAGTWFSLVEALLRGCLEREGSYWDAVRDDAAAVEDLRSDVLREAVPVLRGLRSGQVPATAVDPLRSLLESHEARLGAGPEAESVVLASGLARAIDEANNTTFWASARDRGEQVVERGRAHLIHRYHPQRPHLLFRGPINTNPTKLLAMDPARTAHVRIAGREAAAHRFIFDWDAYGRLLPLSNRARLRIAVCQPNVDLDEFKVTFVEGQGGHRGTFRNHGPRRPRAQREVLLAQIGEAIRLGAHIVVFPEYTVPAGVRQALLDRLQAAGEKAPVLVVLGTAPYVAGDGPWQNQVCIWMARGRPAVLSKCHPAVIDQYREDIESPSLEIRVFMTRRFAIAVLICRDAMEQSVMRQLEDMGVNLCLVAAMTPKASTMVQRASALAAGSQAVVAVGNAPLLWRGSDVEPVPAADRPLAAFHGAYERHPEPLVLRSADGDSGGEPAPGLYLFDVHDREVNWVQAP